MLNARENAYNILCSMERDDAYSTSSLTDVLKNNTDSREAALAGALVFGVTERKLTLDYNLSRYLNKPLKKLKPQVLTILRIGAYQLLFMEKIPSSAAVNEAVKCAKNHGSDYASGLINALLRKIDANGLCFPDSDENREEYLSIRYSVPLPLVKKLNKTFTEERTVEILENTLGRRPVYIRVNTIKTDEDSLIKRMTEEGVTVKKTSLKNCLSISGTGDITQHKSYKIGLFHVQDMSSQICCSVLSPRQGEKVIDTCAAPGGKSFTCAQIMNNRGQVISCDLYPVKTEMIENGAQRLGLGIVDTVCTDAVNIGSIIKDADKVLVDAPCSGFGVMGRKPEIKYKNLCAIEELPVLQLKILTSASRCVKEGGVLVYSTCTLFEEENQNVCESFLSNNPDYILDSSFVSANSVSDKYNLFIPEKDGGDGFFTARFIRRSNG